MLKEHTYTIGKIPSEKKFLLIPSHSATDVGAFTNFFPSTFQSTLQVSLIIPQTVDLPIRKLKDRETYFILIIIGICESYILYIHNDFCYYLILLLGSFLLPSNGVLALVFQQVVSGL